MVEMKCGGGKASQRICAANGLISGAACAEQVMRISSSARFDFFFLITNAKCTQFVQ